MKTLLDGRGIVHALKSVKQSEMHAHKMIVSYACRPNGGTVVESTRVVERDVVDCMTCLVKSGQ